MPNTIQGVGTKYYGRADKRHDGSYITTKFFVFFMIPIWPLGSVRLRESGPMRVSLFTQSQNFELLETLPTDWGQVARIYGTALTVIAVVVVLLKFYA